MGQRYGGTAVPSGVGIMAKSWSIVSSQTRKAMVHCAKGCAGGELSI